MNYFWEHGYQAASMKDLLEAMEIGRQSLYDTFGDKRGLFLASLELYYEHAMESVVSRLSDPNGGLSSIEEYFEMMCDHMRARPCRSCLIINTANELAPRDPEAAAIVRRFIDNLKEAFAAALEVAQRKGDVRVGDLDGAAWNLTNSAMGFGPMSKANISPGVLTGIADEILETIRV